MVMRYSKSVLESTVRSSLNDLRTKHLPVNNRLKSIKVIGAKKSNISRFSLRETGVSSSTHLRKIPLVPLRRCSLNQVLDGLAKNSTGEL